MRDGKPPGDLGKEGPRKRESKGKGPEEGDCLIL